MAGGAGGASSCATAVTAKPSCAAAQDAGQFDLVVVGGGIAGLSAAHRFRQLRGASARILILENHAMPGGEARQNEFDVEGIRLLGPQGSNDFGLAG